jgi:hypothetical protein
VLDELKAAHGTIEIFEIQHEPLQLCDLASISTLDLLLARGTTLHKRLPDCIQKIRLIGPLLDLSGSQGDRTGEINAVEYPKGQDRASVLGRAPDGNLRGGLARRLEELENWTIRAEDAGGRLRPGQWYHAKFSGMTGGVLFTFHEETDGSITPILLDVAFSRGLNNTYEGEWVNRWW